MKPRVLVFLTAIAVGAVLSITLAVATAQNQGAPAARASTATGLKTAWGDPDLQGVWTDDFATPLQRAAQYAGREFFTEQERADLDRRSAAILFARI